MSSATADDGHFVLPAGLTSPQREAVTDPGPLLSVLAGAGAGKTRVLTLRVARRVHDASAEPEHVLVATFSRKAATELRRRLYGLEVGGIEAGTFHRIALSLILRQRADRRAAPPTVLADRRPLLSRVLGGNSAKPRGAAARAGAPTPPGPGQPSVSQLDNEVGWAKARMLAPEAYEDAARRAGRRTTASPVAIAEYYERYEVLRQRQGALDLDDLLWRCADMLESDTAFADAVRWRFRHLFVDEMQDVNPAQFRLLGFLLGDEPDLFVVGDPNQSVYGWNGADPTLLRQLPELFPGTRVIRLEENHRSSPQVVAVAAAALGSAADGAPTSSRPDGSVPRVVAHATDDEEASWVANQVWRAHKPGRRWSQIAVLARTNAQLQAVAEALGQAHIPYQLAGGEAGPASDVRAELTASAGEEEGGEEDGPAGAGPAESGADGVVLATFHRAKGLEWPAVFVIGASDGLVPIASARTAAQREEERRLLYVALTRAVDELTCTWAAAPSDASRRSPRQPSPWLAAVERACASFESAARMAGPEAVSAHLASMRAQLDAEGLG